MILLIPLIITTFIPNYYNNHIIYIYPYYWIIFRIFRKFPRIKRNPNILSIALRLRIGLIRNARERSIRSDKSVHAAQFLSAIAYLLTCARARVIYSTHPRYLVYI